MTESRFSDEELFWWWASNRSLPPGTSEIQALRVSEMVNSLRHRESCVVVSEVEESIIKECAA